jgi:glucose/arabinose dehydrogenase
MVDLSDIGHYYGYPECFTAWNMSEVVSGTSLHTGDQFSIVGNATDSQCQNKTFNVPPRLSMQAHSAPLDITFYSASNFNESVGITRDYDSDAFVSFHGSWDRDPPTGYGVVR